MMSQEHEDIYRLIVDIQQRNQDALAELYDLTISRVFSVALKVTSDQQQAEEVVNDVFLQIWHKASHYDVEKAKPLSWILMITYSRAIDAVRKAKTVANNEVSSEDQFIQLKAEDDTPHENTFASEKNTELADAMTLLNVQQRQCLMLAYFKGMSHQEIANYLGEPLGTVKSVIRRAQSVLRAALGKSELVEGVNYGNA